jgi:hypothetical protein
VSNITSTGIFTGTITNLISNTNDIISLSNSSSSSTSYANIKFNNNANSNAIIGIGGTNYTGYYKNNLFIQAQSSIIFNANNTSNTNPHLFISTVGNIGIGTSTTSTISSSLNIYSSTQNSARITLTGSEFYQGNNSSDGVAIILGINRTGAGTGRQIWFCDSATASIASTTSPAFRYGTNGGDNMPFIDVIATDGSTRLNYLIAPSINCLANGSVGIGTSSTPTTSSSLNIYSTTQNSARITIFKLLRTISPLNEIDTA